MIAPSASYSLTVRAEITKPEVAGAVASAAHRTGVARRRHRLDPTAF